MIKAFLPISFVDWDGHVVSVIFIGGCNYNCPYCHNECLAQTPDRLETMGFEDTIDQLQRYEKWLAGVVITGGEPTHDIGLPVLLRKIRERVPACRIKLDTNGSYPARLKLLVEQRLVDYIALDVKGDRSYYTEVLGVDAEPVFESIKYVMNCGLSYEFRTTYYPAVNLENVGKLIKGAERWSIQRLVIEQHRQDFVPVEKLESDNAHFVKTLKIR